MTIKVSHNYGKIALLSSCLHLDKPVVGFLKKGRWLQA
jgi:hypothetical protein